jgi:tellurite methyltransferase
MNPNTSIGFFDAQFQQQVREADLHLNPFEQAILPYLRGRVLDYGCGLGNLAVAAAKMGCSVLALDASPTAIAHLRRIASEQSLQIEAVQADLRSHELAEDFDSVVSIGLLMFLDCATAFHQLQGLQSHLRSGGVAAINVLVEGTTYRAMFDPEEHCLFSREELNARFSGWEILHSAYQEFAAPMETVKAFVTLIARKPG